MLSISFTKDALKFTQSLETKPARQVYERMLSLTLDPKPAAATALIGFKGFFRLRIGDFRVVYSLDQDEVKVVLIDSRSDDEVYRKLERLVA